jgi:hypothetical protein
VDSEIKNRVHARRPQTSLIPVWLAKRIGERITIRTMVFD